MDCAAIQQFFARMAAAAVETGIVKREVDMTHPGRAIIRYRVPDDPKTYTIHINYPSSCK